MPKPNLLVAARLTSQLLAGPPGDSAESVVARVLAVQAQDPRGARLAVRARSTGVTAADIDEAFTNTRSLVITWLNRGTLHLVTADDYWWLHPLTTPQLAVGNERRLRQEGVSPEQAERGVDIVIDATKTRPRTRGELRALLDDARVPTAGQALVHVLLAASLRGDVIRGPLVGNDHAFISAAAWLGQPPRRLSRYEALAQLARRYLAGYAPASPRDLVKYAGITLGDARYGFASIADETTVVIDDLVQFTDQPAPAPAPPPRLLGAFDPILHGWSNRDDFVGTYSERVASGGLFRPSVLVDGRVVGIWRLATGTINITPFEPLTKRVQAALISDARAVLRYLGIAASIDPHIEGLSTPR